MYELRLKEVNPAATSISYDYNSLCTYLDEMVGGPAGWGVSDVAPIL
jgi:hypothetical protein